MATLSGLTRAVWDCQQETGSRTGGVWVLTCRPGWNLAEHEVVGVYATLADAMPELWDEVNRGLAGVPHRAATLTADDFGDHIEVSVGPALLRLARHQVQPRQEPAR